MLKKTVRELRPYIPEVPLNDLKKQLGLTDLVRLSANENPFGTSPQVTAKLATTTQLPLNEYPDGDANALRQAVAKFLQVDPEQLLFGCGLDEVIELVARTFLEPGDEVVEPWPTFSEYKLHAQIENAKCVDVPVTAAGTVDAAALAAAITDRTKLVWLCNPNNPTGTFMKPAELAALIAKIPENVLVLVDEAYIEFVDAVANPSAVQLLNQFPNLVVMRTFSKAYGLAGMRVGYAVVPKPLIASMQAVRLPYNLNSVSQTLALTALADQDFVAATKQKVIAARQSWTDYLTAQQLPYYQSQTNFIFFKVPDAAGMHDYLMHHGFLVRSGLQPNWLRVTFGSESENAQLQKLMTAYLKDVQ